MAKEEKTVPTKLKTKHGKTFWRFGVAIGPESWVELSLTAAERESLRAACAPLKDGGVLTMEPPLGGPHTKREARAQQRAIAAAQAEKEAKERRKAQLKAEAEKAAGDKQKGKDK